MSESSPDANTDTGAAPPPSDRDLDLRVANTMGMFNYEFRDTKGNLRPFFAPTRNWTQAKAFLAFLEARGIIVEPADTPRQAVARGLDAWARRGAG